MARFEWPSFFPSLSPSLVDMPWLIKWNDTCSEVTVAEQEKEYTAMVLIYIAVLYLNVCST